MNMTEKRKSYGLKFKQSVIKYAEENSNREAGRKFSIDESMVRRWRKKSLDESSGNLEFIARPTLDDDVYEIEVENIENVDDLTDKIIEECEMVHFVVTKIRFF